MNTAPVTRRRCRIQGAVKSVGRVHLCAITRRNHTARPNVNSTVVMRETATVTCCTVLRRIFTPCMSGRPPASFLSLRIFMECRLADLHKELLSELHVRPVLIYVLDYAILLHEVEMELVEFLRNTGRT